MSFYFTEIISADYLVNCKIWCKKGAVVQLLFTASAISLLFYLNINGLWLFYLRSMNDQFQYAAVNMI